MRPRSSLSAVLLAVALVAHLWMLDAPMLRDHASSVPATIAGSQSPLDGAGCSGGMAACRVLPPVEELAFGLMLLAIATLWWRDQEREQPLPWQVDRPERAPPRPTVPASVVLLE